VFFTNTDGDAGSFTQDSLLKIEGKLADPFFDSANRVLGGTGPAEALAGLY
jgi:hypothetical protein